MARMISCGDNAVYAYVTLVTSDEEALVLGFYDRAKTKVNAVSALIGRNPVIATERWRRVRYNTEQKDFKEGWHKTMLPMEIEGEDGTRDHITLCMCVSKAIGTRFLVSSRTSLYGDVYSFLMKNYDMPLLEEWMPEVFQYLIDTRYIQNAYPKCTLDEKTPINFDSLGDLKQLSVYDFSYLTEQSLEDAVSYLLREKKIWITKEETLPLDIPEEDGFNVYIKNYGASLVDNLNTQLEPYSDLTANVDIAIKNKSLFPQQAACINGATALKRNGIKYAILNEGMGVGKVRRCGVRYDCNWNVA